ncbi:MAG TPA: pilus assembly protein N-terminal domain-containing protein [Caulobacteraceae bacterium]|nr:pilus assembly protein N-terminal domain-containing protein [Caulobacteraceae bacterium]
MHRPIWMLSLTVVMTLAAGAAFAAGLSVELNQSRRVILPGVAANVVVANPAIADVAMTDPHSVVIMGKAYGVTEIMVTDHAGRTLFDGRVAVVAPDQARVTVYRGVTPVEYNCAGRCQALAADGVTPAAPAQAATSNNGMMTMTVTEPAPSVAPAANHP